MRYSFNDSDTLQENIIPPRCIAMLAKISESITQMKSVKVNTYGVLCLASIAFLIKVQYIRLR